MPELWEPKGPWGLAGMGRVAREPWGTQVTRRCTVVNRPPLESPSGPPRALWARAQRNEGHTSPLGANQSQLVDK